MSWIRHWQKDFPSFVVEELRVEHHHPFASKDRVVRSEKHPCVQDVAVSSGSAVSLIPNDLQDPLRRALVSPRLRSCFGSPSTAGTTFLERPGPPSSPPQHYSEPCLACLFGFVETLICFFFASCDWWMGMKERLSCDTAQCILNKDQDPIGFLAPNLPVKNITYLPESER